MKSEQHKPENPWLNLGFNILVPALLLLKGNKWFDASPSTTLIIALMFPLSYGSFDFVRRKQCNFLSVIGFVSVLITGGVGLLKLSKDWIAVKEAAVPGLFALAVLFTARTSKPLVKRFLFNDQFFDVALIESKLETRNKRAAFEKLLVQSTLLLALSFLVSSILNYLLARFLIRSETGSHAFNEELAKMTFWSYPVIVLPSMAVMFLALWMLLRGIHQLTDLGIESVMRTVPREQDKATSSTPKRP